MAMTKRKTRRRQQILRRNGGAKMPIFRPRNSMPTTKKISFWQRLFGRGSNAKKKRSWLRRFTGLRTSADIQLDLDDKKSAEDATKEEKRMKEKALELTSYTNTEDAAKKATPTAQPTEEIIATGNEEEENTGGETRAIDRSVYDNSEEINPDFKKDALEVLFADVKDIDRKDRFRHQGKLFPKLKVGDKEQIQFRFKELETLLVKTVSDIEIEEKKLKSAEEKLIEEMEKYKNEFEPIIDDLYAKKNSFQKRLEKQANKAIKADEEEKLADETAKKDEEELKKIITENDVEINKLKINSQRMELAKLDSKDFRDNQSRWEALIEKDPQWRTEAQAVLDSETSDVEERKVATKTLENIAERELQKDRQRDTYERRVISINDLKESIAENEDIKEQLLKKLDAQKKIHKERKERMRQFRVEQELERQNRNYDIAELEQMLKNSEQEITAVNKRQDFKNAGRAIKKLESEIVKIKLTMTKLTAEKQKLETERDQLGFDVTSNIQKLWKGYTTRNRIQRLLVNRTNDTEENETDRHEEIEKLIQRNKDINARLQRIPSIANKKYMTTKDIANKSKLATIVVGLRTEINENQDKILRLSSKSDEIEKLTQSNKHIHDKLKKIEGNDDAMDDDVKLLKLKKLHEHSIRILKQNEDRIAILSSNSISESIRKKQELINTLERNVELYKRKIDHYSKFGTANPQVHTKIELEKTKEKKATEIIEKEKIELSNLQQREQMILPAQLRAERNAFIRQHDKEKDISVKSEIATWIGKLNEEQKKLGKEIKYDKFDAVYALNKLKKATKEKEKVEKEEKARKAEKAKIDEEKKAASEAAAASAAAASAAAASAAAPITETKKNAAPTKQLPGIGKTAFKEAQANLALVIRNRGGSRRRNNKSKRGCKRRSRFLPKA